VAALKRFGLLEDRGSLTSREARLTDFAQAIILDVREDSTERQKRLQDAALAPSIHREIWDKYEGALPSNSTLRYYLTVERGFTPDGADDFIDEFRHTLEFAHLAGDSDTVSPVAPDSDETPTGPAVAPRRFVSTMFAPSPEPTAPPPIQFPVHGATVMLQSTAPLNDAAWSQMMDVLETLKPAIVASSEPGLPSKLDEERRPETAD
jgi:hypothetical protein